MREALPVGDQAYEVAGLRSCRERAFCSRGCRVPDSAAPSFLGVAYADDAEEVELAFSGVVDGRPGSSLP